MSEDRRTSTPRRLDDEMRDVKLKGHDEDTVVVKSLHTDQLGRRQASEKERPPHLSAKSSATPSKASTPLKSPALKSEQEEVVGGDIELKMEIGETPKLSRKASQKVVSRPPQLITHLPDATAEATSSFSILTDCHYAAKYLGYTEPPLECDCSEEWGMSLFHCYTARAAI